MILVAYRSLLEVVPAAGQSAEKTWGAGVGRSLAQLSRLAPRVEIISDITSLDFSPGDCLTDPRATMATCTQREQQVFATGNSLTRAVARAHGARFVDVTGLVCVHHRCPLVVGGVVTYRDAWHLSSTWGRVVAAALGRRLALDGNTPD